MPRVDPGQRPAPPTGVLRRLFPVPQSRLDAAHSWLDEASGPRLPRRPRDASAVVLIKDSPQGVQAWLGQRSVRSPLGVVSFPGGSTVESDAEAPTWYGPTPTQWAARMGTTDFVAARTRVLTAVRELFEGTGVLLAGPDELSVAEDLAPDEAMAARLAMAEGDLSLAQFLGRRGWGVRSDLLRPVGHWISADFELFRFDTWYFAAAVPAGQEATALQQGEGKAKWGRWVGVNETSARPESVELGDEIGAKESVDVPLSGLSTPATQVFLSKLQRTRGCVAYLSSRRPVGNYQPELVSEGSKLYLDVTTVEASEGGAVHRGR